MTISRLSYIQWFNSYCFESKVILGTKGVYYIFEADYNVRSESWQLTISTEDEVVLVQSRKLVVNVDVLEFCFNKLKPDCYLVPIIDNDNITSVGYDNMVNGMVKLMHITDGDIELLKN